MNVKKFIGKRVTIMGSHIYSGYSGIIISEMETLIGPLLNVQLDNGQSTKIFPSLTPVDCKIGHNYERSCIF
jgi:hypothetical protein